MPKDFDVIAKRLVDGDPLAFLRLFGLPGDHAELADSELSTVQLAADRLLQVYNPRYMAHFEFQTGYDPGLPRRARAYNLAADDKHDQEVDTTVLLLRKAADGPAITGRLQRRCLTFTYRVVRLWEIDPETLLSESPALWPLAPIAHVPKAHVPDIIARIGEQAERADMQLGDRKVLWAEIYFLLGLRYKRSDFHKQLRGAMAMVDMRDSDTYMAVLEEGEERGREQGREQGLAQGQQIGKEALVARLIRRRFGDLSKTTTSRLDRLTAHELDELGEALLDFTSPGDLDAWLAARQ